MTSSRIVIVAGAGIGGLTAALALVRNGFRVIVLEQAERLEETGAGIQLSPNAARTLIDLGLEERLRPHVIAPEALRVLSAKSGREIVRIPLGEPAAQRYGAPYWVIHRGDLQAALSGAVAQELDITVKLGMRMEDFVAHPNGVTVSARGHAEVWDERGLALIAADGLWSLARTRIGYSDPPRFSGRAAWRAMVRAKDVAPEFREPLIHLWLGRDAHLVHYPVKGGSVINIVIIMNDSWNAAGWSEPASRVRVAAAPACGAVGAAGPIVGPCPRGLAEMVAVRSPAAAERGAGTGGAAWRRRPSDVAVSRPRRRNGDRGCGRSRAMPGAHAGRCVRSAANLFGRAARPGLESAAARDPQRRALPPHRRARYAARRGHARCRRPAAAAALRLAL